MSTRAGLDPETSPPDTNIAENITHKIYKAGTGAVEPSHPGVDGRRVVVIPIAKNPPAEGRDTIVIDRFGIFFLQKSVGGGNGGELTAEYVDTITLAGIGRFNPAGGPGNNLLAIPVIYK